MDNPNAFPACNEANVNDTMGMSLRDWFAGLALAAMPKLGDTDAGVNDIAHDAYLLADAMLAARQPQQPNEKD